VTQHKGLSDDTAHAIDEEVRAFIDRNYDRAAQILNDNLDKLHAMAEALIKYETIDREQIKDIMEGRDPRPPAGWGGSEPKSPDGGAPAGAEDTASKESGSQDSGSKDKPIGDPAGQH